MRTQIMASMQLTPQELRHVGRVLDQQESPSDDMRTFRESVGDANVAIMTQPDSVDITLDVDAELLRELACIFGMRRREQDEPVGLDADLGYHIATTLVNSYIQLARSEREVSLGELASLVAEVNRRGGVAQAFSA